MIVKLVMQQAAVVGDIQRTDNKPSGMPFRINEVLETRTHPNGMVESKVDVTLHVDS